MIVQCENCATKRNNEVAEKCPICFPKRKNNSPSRKRGNKKYWENVRINGQKKKYLSETIHIISHPHDWYAMGKRKNWPEINGITHEPSMGQCHYCGRELVLDNVATHIFTDGIDGKIEVAICSDGFGCRASNK